VLKPQHAPDNISSLSLTTHSTAIFSFQNILNHPKILILIISRLPYNPQLIYEAFIQSKDLNERSSFPYLYRPKIELCEEGGEKDELWIQDEIISTIP